MTEAYKSLAIKVLIAVLTSLATQLHLQGGAGDVPAIATDAVDLALAVFAFYRSSGMKLVPHTSAAVRIYPDAPKVIPGDRVVIGSQTVGHVVGALLIAFLLCSHTTDARAQTAPSVLSAAETQLYASLNVVFGFVGGFLSADLNAAIADAQAQTPPNTQAVACWQAIGKIPVSSIPTGAGLAYLKQRFLDLQSLYMPLNLNCGSVAPLFLKEYNQFMSLAAAQNL